MSTPANNRVTPSSSTVGRDSSYNYAYSLESHSGGGLTPSDLSHAFLLSSPSGGRDSNATAAGVAATADATLQQTQRASVSTMSPESLATSDPSDPSKPPLHLQAPSSLQTHSLTSLSSSSISSSSSSSSAELATPLSQSSPSPLALPAHPTTPSAGSSMEALEAAAGINLQKLGPADFTFTKSLGEGSFAKVFLATLKSDPTQQYACKVVDKNFVQKMGKIHTVLNEKKILTLLAGHVGVVQLKFTFQDNNSLYFVMELAPGGEMFDDIKRVGKYSLELSRFYAAELVEILYYMHSKRIIHRDLKPENVLLSKERHIKLTDYGTSKQLEVEEPPAADAADAVSKAKKRRGSFVGTAEYVCPEILNDQASDAAADAWSLGCVLFQMLTGKVPFRGASEYLTFQKILKCQVKYPIDLDFQAKDLLQHLFVLDPTKRWGATLESYSMIKSHPFFEGVNFDTIFSQDVPPLPPVSIIQPDEPDVIPDVDNENADEDEDNSDEDENHSAEFDDPEEEEAFRLKMEELAREEAAAVAAEAADQVAALPASSASPPASSSSSASSSNTPISPHGPTLDERVAAVHKTSTDGQYTSSVWSRFLKAGERIIYTGLIIKRRGLFARKRQLILTDGPRLFYVDPQNMEMKKEVEWSEKLWAEVIDDSTFYIHIPGRDYYMRGLSSSSFCWVNEVNQLQLRLKGGK